MTRAERFWDRMTQSADLLEESMPGQPIVEIAGTGRLLIEEHGGVISYSREKISVRVAFGCIHVCGCGLQIRRMSRDQLMIVGRIDAVNLQRRG